MILQIQRGPVRAKQCPFGLTSAWILHKAQPLREHDSSVPCSVKLALRLASLVAWVGGQRGPNFKQLAANRMKPNRTPPHLPHEMVYPP